LIEGVIEHVVHAWIEGGGDKPAIMAELGELPPIMADGERLQQIFTNLVENALRYASPPILLTADVEGDWVTFVVSDSGEGITESDLARLFDKFFRRSGERRSGTGLGLYIVRGLVEAHNGKVWATSTIGVGSQFHVRLPR
jgi:signal transduction histidine kinase